MMCKFAFFLVFVASVASGKGWRISAGTLHARPSLVSKDLGTQVSREALRTLLLSPNRARPTRLPAARMVLFLKEKEKAKVKSKSPVSEEENEAYGRILIEDLKQNLDEAAYLVILFAVAAVITEFAIDNPVVRIFISALASSAALSAGLWYLLVRPRTRREAWGPRGEDRYHATKAQLTAAFAKLPPAPKDVGEVKLLAIRHPDGHREELSKAVLSTSKGLPGDRWERQPTDLTAQIAVMRYDVAQMIANGQDLKMAGDQFFVDLDLTEANLPIGSRLRVGEAEVVVTPKQHNGCNKFAERFGKDALIFVSNHSGSNGCGRVNHRGIFWRCVKDGEVREGSKIQVLARNHSEAVITTEKQVVMQH